MEIRPFAETDAAEVVALELAVKPHQLQTERGLLHDIRNAPARERRRDWVAVHDGSVVGHAVAGFNWAVPTEGKGWLIVKVLPEHRAGGIGTTLFELAESHLVSEDAREFRSWSHEPDGQRFLERRGFRPNRRMEISSLELGRLDLSPLATLESARRSEGFELASLADVADLRGIHAVYAAGEEDMPSDEPETELDYETWAAETLGHPDMSGQESVVVLAEGRPVGLAFLTLDRDRKLGYNEMTATAPGFRRRGLGLLAKLEASRRAIGAGVERLLTENDGENDGMLAINRRLGYATVMVDQQFLRR